MIKILIVLEGERTESDFFESILGKFELNAELLVVGTNLYTLYHKCRLYDFECDVKDVLIKPFHEQSPQSKHDSMPAAKGQPPQRARRFRQNLLYWIPR